MRLLYLSVAILSLASCGDKISDELVSHGRPPPWCDAFSGVSGLSVASIEQRDKVYNQIVDNLMQEGGAPSGILELLDAARAAIAEDRYSVIQDYGIDTGENVYCPPLQRLLDADRNQES